MLTITETWAEDYDIYNLFSLLTRTSELQVTDPRDKIYALLGLITVSDRSLFLPRYDVSVPEAYTLFTIASIKDDKDLSMLMAADRESPESQFPSWVPDWRRPPRSQPLDDIVIYNSSQGITQNFEELEHTPSPELPLDGAQIDIISESYALVDLCQEL